MIVRILSALALSVLPVVAEQIEVRTLSLIPGEIPECFVEGKEGLEPLAFSTIQPTPPVELKVEGHLPIYRADAPEPGKPGPPLAAKVKLPGSKEVLLLVMNVGRELRFVALEDNIGAAGPADWMLINATTRPIAFRVGGAGDPVRINPGTSKLERIRAKEDQGAAVEAHALFDDGPKKIYSTYWAIRAGKRSIVLFVESGEKIKVKQITEAIGGARRAQE